VSEQPEQIPTVPKVGIGGGVTVSNSHHNDELEMISVEPIVGADGGFTVRQVPPIDPLQTPLQSRVTEI
jgi:hypothetical protein